MHVSSKSVVGHVGSVRPERIAGRRVIDDRPVSLADLIRVYHRRHHAAQEAAADAQQAADALNEGLRMVGGRDAATTLDGFTYQHSIGGLKVSQALDPSSPIPN